MFPFSYYLGSPVLSPRVVYENIVLTLINIERSTKVSHCPCVANIFFPSKLRVGANASFMAILVNSVVQMILSD